MTDSQLILLVIFLVLGGIAVVANLAEKRPTLRPLLHVVLVGTNVLFTGNFVLLPLTAPPQRVDEQNAGLVIVLALFFGSLATLLLLARVRQRLVPIFARPQSNILGDTGAGYDPDSMIQMATLVGCVYLIGYTVLTFLIRGGLSGLASGYTAATPVELLLQMGVFVGLGVLGVGFGVRRSWRETRRRLGLFAPDITELMSALLIAFLLFCAVFVIGNLWELVTPQDVIRQQTQLSELVSSSIVTLTMAFFVAATAAIGEEILFRGALQPIFGLWPTAIFFALSHIQYTLTPAALVIVIVGIGLGWLRRRYNTTAALIAHFLYDFGLLALAIYARLFTDIIGYHP